MLHHVLAHLFTPRHTNNHRPRIIHPEGFLVLTVIALGFFISVRTVTQPFRGILGYSSSITPTRVVELTNAQRINEGLSPLVLDPKLTAAAAAKAADMFNKQYWAHVSPDGITPWVFIKNSGYHYSVAGENLARDFGDTEGVVNAWMNSPTHRANILQSKYQDIGVAVVNGVLNNVETTLVVQEFGAKKNVIAQIPQNAVQQEEKAAPAVPASPPPLQEQTSEVLAQETVYARPSTEPLSMSPLFSPLQLSKAFFLGMLFLLLAVLFYDMIIAHHRNTVRIVGKNIAHIALFLTVTFLVVFFKGGLTL